jgi:hypothetical protein
MARRNVVAGVIVMAIGSGLFVWVVQAANPKAAADVIGIGLAIVTAAALVVSLVADARHFQGVPSGNWMYVTLAATLIGAVGSLAGGMVWGALALSLAATTAIVLRIRSRPRSKEAH